MINPTNQNQKILLYDIETAPNLGWTWGKWEQNVIEFERNWYMLTFSYKWLGESKVHGYALPDFPTYKKNSEDDKELIKKLWELFNEADIIIGHNSDEFDIKKSNVRFIEHGLPPPSPYKTIDTKKVAKRYFKWDSNKLDDLGQYLQVGRKNNTGGFELWTGCMKGDKKSWKKMLSYNKQDVVLLEKVYLKLRGWMNNHPEVSYEIGNGCPGCGSHNMHKRGFNKRKTSRGVMSYQRFQCRNCAMWSQDKKGIEMLVLA